MKKLIILSFCLFAVVMTGLSQRPGGGSRSGGQMPKLKLVGQITDGATSQGLEFATVSVFSKRDSSLVGGGMTATDGTFSVDVKPGPMYAVIEFISYESITKDVEIDRDAIRSGNRQIDLGTVQLFLNSTQLDEVEIRAEKSETQFSLDKRVFNVGKDLANRGGSAEEVLDNVPSVTVDIEGNVSLRGSQGVRILIDGRPSGLAGVGNTNGLRNIPANMIEKVEVITNPSARYEASGMAGIINIVMKKDTGHGFNGSFDATLGIPEQQGLGANLNYRKDKLNWFANYSIRNRTGPGGGFTYTERTVGDLVEILDSNRDQNRGGLSNSFRFGADYFLDDKTQITAALSYRISDENNLSTITYDSLNRSITSITPEFLSSTIRTDNETENESNLQYSLNYRKEFSSRNHVFNATLQYRDEIETESSIFDEVYTPVGEQGVSSLYQESNNDELEKVWLAQFDFSKPLGKDHKYEIGFRTSLRDLENDYIVQDRNADGSLSVLELNGQLFDDKFIYDENIHALYAIYGNKHGKFSYQGGMRTEYSDVLTIADGISNPRTYLDFFPSAHLNYELAEGNAMQISYSRRIDRPRSFYLNPFFTLSDRINLFGGNPNLDPEYTDSYEIGNIKYWDKFTLSTSLFYRHTEDNIQRIQSLNLDGTTTRKPQNIGTADDYGLDMNISYSGLEWLRLDGNGNFFKATSNGFFEGEEFDLDNFTWFGRMTARITVFDSDIQLRGNYRGGRQSIQGSSQGAGSIDIGWSKDFLNDRLTLTLSVRDLLNSRKRRGITEFENFYQESEFQWRARSSTLTASYRINQKKKRGGGNRGHGGGDGGGEEF